MRIKATMSMAASLEQPSLWIKHAISLDMFSDLLFLCVGCRQACILLGFVMLNFLELGILLSLKLLDFFVESFKDTGNVRLLGKECRSRVAFHALGEQIVQSDSKGSFGGGDFAIQEDNLALKLGFGSCLLDAV